MNIKITSDSTCDLTPELIRQHNIDILPLSIALGERICRDGVDMTVEDLFRYVDETGQLPKTAAVNAAEYADVFRKYTSEGCCVIHFCLCSEFSSCYQNACIAAADFENVYVIDSRNLSTGQGLLVLHAAELAESGTDAAEIVEECKALAEKAETSFVINSLDYLYKGGRCSALSVMGANVLKLKPCIEVKDGKMVPEKKYRGHFGTVILQYVRDRLENRTDIDDSRLILTSSGCTDEILSAVKEQIRKSAPQQFREIIETTAGATITTHCGAPALGLIFFRK